jgi:hypothetical protein
VLPCRDGVALPPPQPITGRRLPSRLDTTAEEEEAAGATTKAEADEEAAMRRSGRRSRSQQPTLPPLPLPTFGLPTTLLPSRRDISMVEGQTSGTSTKAET